MKVIAAKLAIAIEKLHSMKIVHRDVKPANIIYNKKTERLALIDFGCSIQLDPIDTEMSTKNGTPKYMAEEVLNGDNYNYTVDWYSYGATLLIMFGGDITMFSRMQNRKTKNTKIYYYNGLDKHQKSLVQQCLERREKRVKSVADVKSQTYFKELQWDQDGIKFCRNTS